MTYKVPAENLQAIKTAMIDLGYATTETPMITVQDVFYKYMRIHHTGANPHIPYDFDSLPEGALKEGLLSVIEEDEED